MQTLPRVSIPPIEPKGSSSFSLLSSMQTLPRCLPLSCHSCRRCLLSRCLPLSCQCCRRCLLSRCLPLSRRDLLHCVPSHCHRFHRRRCLLSRCLPLSCHRHCCRRCLLSRVSMQTLPRVSMQTLPRCLPLSCHLFLPLGPLELDADEQEIGVRRTRVRRRQ